MLKDIESTSRKEKGKSLFFLLGEKNQVNKRILKGQRIFGKR
jgi:hypothetical protein